MENTTEVFSFVFKYYLSLVNVRNLHPLQKKDIIFAM